MKVSVSSDDCLVSIVKRVPTKRYGLTHYHYFRLSAWSPDRHMRRQTVASPPPPPHTSTELTKMAVSSCSNTPTLAETCLTLIKYTEHMARVTVSCRQNDEP